MKKDRSTTSKLSSGVIKDFSHFSKLNEYFKEYNVDVLPIVKKSQDSITFPTSEYSFHSHKASKAVSKPLILDKPHIIIITADHLHTTLLQIVIKNCPLQPGHIKAIDDTFGTTRTITTLRLEYCYLTELAPLKDFLINASTINDLSLNGNPGISQEIVKILQETSITILSVCSCQLEDTIIYSIAEEIRNKNKLCALNVSSNKITDEGLQHLSDALRINRSLKLLNISDNYITTEGCIALTKVLQKFPLNHAEIVMRRRHIIERIKTIANMVESYKLLKPNASKLVNSIIETPASAKSNPRRSRSSQLKIKKISSKETASTVSSNDVYTNSYYERLAMDELGPDTHPMIAESYPKNQAVYCKGNFILQHINLSYNKITPEVIDEIFELCDYQVESNNGNAPTFKLNGNCIDEGDLEHLERYVKRKISISQPHTKSSRSLTSHSKFHASKLENL